MSIVSKRVLVTGGAGFLGSHLCDRLVAAGVDKDHRGREKASDHAPVWVEIAD